MEKPVCDECLTSQSCAILMESIYAAKDEILGSNFYCVAPVNGIQCCEYYLEEIIRYCRYLERRATPWYARFCRFILRNVLHK